MMIKYIPGILSSLMLGFALGFVPVLNRYLHWNIWFILPIGGCIFGAVAGWTQFHMCYLLGRKREIGRVAFAILPLAAVTGYALVDYGSYLSTTIHLKDVEPLPEGDYRLSDIISFWDYMSVRLGSSSVSRRDGTKLYDMGATGTTLSYFIDLGGAILGAVGILGTCVEECPYWWRPSDS